MRAAVPSQTTGFRHLKQEIYALKRIWAVSLWGFIVASAPEVATVLATAYHYVVNWLDDDGGTKSADCTRERLLEEHLLPGELSPPSLVLYPHRRTLQPRLRLL